jgi:bifunctional non-homologous end joining protein LigD
MSTWSARTRLARDQLRPEGFIAPMLATPGHVVPTGLGWQFEVKHDGYRMLSRADAKPRIWSRWGLSWTHSFPSITASLRTLDRVALIDGEAVCQFEDGHSDFHALAGDEGCAQAVLWAFDLLMIDGEDIRALPLEVRRERLRRLLEDTKPEGIAFSDHQDGDGIALFAAACRMGLEGIVAKRKGSRYASGRSKAWVKVKNPHFRRREAEGDF